MAADEQDGAAACALEGTEARLETWLRVVVALLGLERATPVTPTVAAQAVEARGTGSGKGAKGGKEGKGVGAIGAWQPVPAPAPAPAPIPAAKRPPVRFAQVSVPAVFAEELRQRFAGQGYEVRLGRSLTAAFRGLTVWKGASMTTTEAVATEEHGVGAQERPGGGEAA